MKDIYAIGPKESVLLFQGLGIESFIINNETKLKEKIEELKKDAKIIFISESLMPLLEEFIKKYKDLTYPIILFVPLEGVKTGAGLDKLRKAVERAIGMAIL